ncbi:hypothetical protein J7382_03855 [Shimia sp. R11_0]|uniref:hypothetical protein n=1 Tax=Shimia sp. R11_0 TaxID=2821096 RepID=UPI001ADCD3E5|nr:hypothetical protein [Shimia sp. R11_0]MBO9476664.1 hypothetical protein [Shimia sp. R11_0]
MKHVGKFFVSVVAAIMLSSAVFAGTLGQSAALKVLEGGQLKFDAGSRATFSSSGNGQGTFVFDHGSKREKGTYVVAKDGVVTCYKKNGKPYYSFVVDEEGGKTSLRYVSGRYKGKSFSFK